MSVRGSKVQVSSAPTGPFAMSEGLSFNYLGEMIHHFSTMPGRYRFVDGTGESAVLVVYEDRSWRITTPQLDLWEEENGLAGRD